MSIWYLYIIENRFKHLYTGISTDPQRRYAEHCAGGVKAAKALKGKGPLQQVYCVEIGNRSEATKAERWVKRLSHQQKWQLIHQQLCLPVL